MSGKADEEEKNIITESESAEKAVKENPAVKSETIGEKIYRFCCEKNNGIISKL